MQTTERVWFITGASSGFGRALAEAVIGRREKAIVAAQRREPLAQLTASDKDGVLALTLDVTEPGARTKSVTSALERFQRIDVLANIAGRGRLEPSRSSRPTNYAHKMDLNFFSAAELTREVLPVMRRQGTGHILNLTSIGGLISIGGFGAYCASKFALEAWSEALADEVVPFGLKVTLVEPGNFRTEFAGEANMRPKTQLEAYRPVIGPIEEFLFGQNGRQAGDPAKAADAMIAVVNDPTPPCRLVLGADAYDVLDRTMAARMMDISRYRKLGEQTGFDGVEVRPIGA
jgi:NAD(P)-dependent dehydrogenase (short-subunit alcohol dehydrogenase family)